VNFLLAPSIKETKELFVKESLILHQSLSLCSSLTNYDERHQASFFEAVRVLLNRLENSGGKKKYSLTEVNEKVNELLKQSVVSEGVINLFEGQSVDFSLFDPRFLEEISKMKEKNLAVELLKKLIAEQIKIYRRTNVVKAEKFSEIIQTLLNGYLNGMLTNEQVIEELMKLADEIKNSNTEGSDLGLTSEEVAFYDALTKPAAIKDFYSNEQLVQLTRELTESLRKNKTIDWQRREGARSSMKMLVKRLLKKYKYPPEGFDDAVQTVLTQCELWTDNTKM
jgi:type I restriction enzyme R subunit